jgi:hypothetical protein
MYRISYLDKSFNGQMLEILRSSPITTDAITLCFDRQPDIFKLPEIKYEQFKYLGFFRENTLEGFAMNGYHQAMINGKPESVFHFTDLYIKPESRAKGFSYRISDYFYRETYNNTRLGYGIIMEGNNEALRLIGRRHPRFPYMPWARFINKLEVKSIVLAWPVKEDSLYEIRHATAEDIPTIVKLLNEEHKNRLFGMCYSEKTFQSLISKRPGFTIDNYYLALNKFKDVCGVCAAWDCNSFKQNRVIRYGKKFLPARIGHWILEGLYRLPSLPATGDSFRDITITDYAVKGRDPNIMKALLKMIYNDYRKKGYHTMIWGSSIDDPLLKAAGGFFQQSVISNIILFGTTPELIEDEGINKYMPYIDVACL